MVKLQPTITFIIPIQKKESFLMEEINSVFKFSELYPGFCELIIPSDVKEEAIIKLLWLSMKLNKANNPHVRTKIINYTANQDMNSLIETGINHALGEKIVIMTANPEEITPSHIERFNMFKKEIIVAQLFTGMPSLKELLPRVNETSF